MGKLGTRRAVRGVRATLLLTVLLSAGAAPADDSSGAGEIPVPAEAADGEREAGCDWRWWLDNEYYKISLNVRPRMELAKQDGADFSQAYTVRSLVGVGSKPRYGLSGFAEMEGTFSFDRNAYWDGVRSSNDDKTKISDPPHIELNQGWAQYENPDFFGVEAKAGRQRIKLDDDRWVGNVGWRQNEQTFDSTRAATSLGIEGLHLGYSYTWHVNRIFADKGDSSTEDFDSDSHFVRLHYSGWKPLQASAFAYVMDFENDSPGNSANTYGFRVDGSTAFAQKWKVGYTASYAYQTDAADNPVDYDAHYAWVSSSVAYEPIAELGAGFELLGSDDGTARVVTPLATGHKFNGFADVFLDNGGVNGLQDLFFWLAPKLPWKLKGKVIFHQFWSDEGGRDLGWEADLVLSRPINEHLTVLTKATVFDGSDRGPADIWRYWLQITFSY